VAGAAASGGAVAAQGVSGGDGAPVLLPWSTAGQPAWQADTGVVLPPVAIWICSRERAARLGWTTAQQKWREELGRHIAQVDKVFGSCALRLNEKLAVHAETGASFDIEGNFSQLTLDVIGLSLFNYDFDALNKESPVIQAVYASLKETEMRATVYTQTASRVARVALRTSVALANTYGVTCRTCYPSGSCRIPSGYSFRVRRRRARQSRCESNVASRSSVDRKTRVACCHLRRQTHRVTR
jgi:hypothetical protein